MAALQVFAGGACYGAMATTYKLAYAAGFTSAQVVASQVWFGFLFFALAVLLSRLRGGRWRHLAGRQMLKLIGLDAFLFALGATVTCSLFVTLSGKVKAPCSNKQRGLVVCLGVGVMSLTVCPDYLVSGVVSQGILPFAAVAGFFGLMCPVLLFGLGSPHLPAGLSTVMAAAELPAGLLIAMVVLGEPLGVIEWLGVAVILAGVCLAQVPSLRARPRSGEVCLRGFSRLSTCSKLLPTRPPLPGSAITRARSPAPRATHGRSGRALRALARAATSARGEGLSERAAVARAR